MRVHFARLTIIALTLGFFSPEFAIATSEEPKSEPFPQGIGKKGLQVQMVDDAISLGIHHAAININLTSLLQLDPKQNTIRFAHGGKEWFMNGSYAASLDRQIQPLSDATIIVYAILLAYPSRDSARDAVMLHPNATGSFTIAAFNTAGEEGLQAYRAIISTSCFKKQIPQTGRRRWNLHCPLLDSGNGMTSMNRGTQFQNVLNPSICRAGLIRIPDGITFLEIPRAVLLPKTEITDNFSAHMIRPSRSQSTLTGMSKMSFTALPRISILQRTLRHSWRQ